MVQDQLVKLMSPTKRRAGRLRTGGRAIIPTVENRGLSVLQLNVEGLTTAKLEVLRHLANSNGAAVLLLQETHCTSDNILKIPGFHLAGSIYSKQHGVATFVRTEISWSASSQSPPGSNIEWLVTKIQETSVVNVYKPPPSELSTTSLPPITAPAIYAGDFNCQHTDWGYNYTTPNGVALSEWASNTDALLLYDPKEPPTFFSARWNTSTNLDLAFAICHRPDTGTPVKRWNFRKANWESYAEETERRSAGLPDPADLDAAYAAYCQVLLGAAKKSIPRGYNRNYIPDWDEECSHFLCDHQRASSREEVDVTAAALLKKLDITRRARWTEVVESIDFTHSSRKAWQTINQLTGRNTTPHSCPVTANAIASQLLKNGRFPDADKAFARLTSRKVSCISGAASVDSNLSGEFTAEELSEAMSKLKPGKSPGRDNIHPEFKTSPRSRTSFDMGSLMLRNRAVRGGGGLRETPAIHLRAVAEAGPLARTTATPHLPWPDDKAKMLSASASPNGIPSQVDKNLQGGVPML
ncbi:hypothetical protein KUCAC02_023323 [Chaenocephalus aceratus]|uniref:Uncharacterized protein n=1 Tax=Chaenocephalus aceratus TaxID=36190 RepID=A0ACB9XRQ3_CHAAC|nr:hypothetical protein KUCAC02_023323 [Chaenocephalus aceratus]